MDDVPTTEPLPLATQKSASRFLVNAVLIAVASSLSGCSLFVMAGKLFYGDPKMICAFHAGTGIDLADGERTVLVIYSTPESVKAEFPSIEFDLTEQTIRRLKYREINVIDPDDVATFIDDNGGFWHDETDLARHFDADIIIHIDLDEFTCKETGSPTLLRGRADGNLYAYRVSKKDGEKVANEIFVREISSTYPRQTPVSTDRMTRKTFQKQYIDRMATQIAQMLHDHRASELIQ